MHVCGGLRIYAYLYVFPFISIFLFFILFFYFSASSFPHIPYIPYIIQPYILNLCIEHFLFVIFICIHLKGFPFVACWLSQMFVICIADTIYVYSYEHICTYAEVFPFLLRTSMSVVVHICTSVRTHAYMYVTYICMIRTNIHSF